MYRTTVNWITNIHKDSLIGIEYNVVASVAIATYMFFSIVLLIKCVLSTVARLVRHSDTRSFFFFLLLAVSFQRCVVYREDPHFSRVSSFLASILTSPRCLSRVVSFLVSVLASPHSPHFIVYREHPHFPWALASSRSSPHLTPHEDSQILTWKPIKRSELRRLARIS